MRGARAALVFLTRLPAGRLQAEDFAAAPGWFAAVGLLIGALQAAVFVIAALLWPPELAALLAVAVGLLITGGLHEDGLADVFDGLGSGSPKPRALEIMRDSQIGSYGALSLGLAMAARILALTALGPLAPLLLIAGQGASRAAMAMILRKGPYLRASGAGTGMTGALGAAGGVALVIALIFALSLTGWGVGWATLGGVAGLLSGAGAMRLWAMRRLGGVTGDVLGGAQVLGDIGFLLGVLACL